MNLQEEIRTYRHRAAIGMRWSDCDMLGHVNNAVFLTYAEQGRTDYFKDLQWDWSKYGIILARAEVDFIKPLLYTDIPFIYTKCARMGNKSFDMECLITHEKDTEQRVVARMKCILVMIDYHTGVTFPIPDEVKVCLKEFEEGK